MPHPPPSAGATFACPRCACKDLSFSIPVQDWDGRLTPSQWTCWRCGHRWLANPDPTPVDDERSLAAGELEALEVLGGIVRSLEANASYRRRRDRERRE